MRSIQARLCIFLPYSHESALPSIRDFKIENMKKYKNIEPKIWGFSFLFVVNPIVV